MKRLSRAVCALGVLLGTGAGAQECEWKPPRKAPIFEARERSGVEVAFSADAKWFNCVKKQKKGTLAVLFTVEEEGGARRTLPARPITSYGARESLGLRDICEKGPGTKTVRASLVGQGEMARLDFTSEPARLYCERCEWRSWNHSLALFTDRRATPAGLYTLEGRVDPDWHRCAREGSTLELWLFAAPTELEARQLQEPTHKVTGLESSAHFKKSFPRAPLCQGGTRWLGYQLHGTGEMQKLNDGRGAVEARCTP